MILAWMEARSKSEIRLVERSRAIADAHLNAEGDSLQSAVAFPSLGYELKNDRIND